MMKKSNFEEALASDMDAIMKDSGFASLFSKASINKEASDENCAHDCPMKHDHNHKCDDKCEDKAMAKDAASAVSEALTLEATVQKAVQDLSKISEALDSMGLEKTASLSLNLANYILVEAKKKSDKKDEKSGKDTKSDKKDKADKKEDKKSDKKDEKSGKDKKSDKKDDKKAPPFFAKKK